MAKQPTVSNVDAGDDIAAAWGDEVKADVEALFADKEIYAESDGATITFDQDNGAFQKVTLEGNRTLALDNVVVGKPLVIILRQDGTGGRIATWFSTIHWSYGATPILSTGVNKYDVFLLIPVASNTYLGFIVGQDMG